MLTRWVRRTFLDGEGELRRATFGLLALAVLSFVVVLAFFVTVVPTPVWLAWFAALGYVLGERSGSDVSGESEAVAPPFISSE